MIFALLCFSFSKTVTYRELEIRSRKDLQDQYKDLYSYWKKTGDCHTGGSSDCTTGTHAQFDIDGTFKRVNFYRYLTGLKPTIQSTDTSLIDEEMKASMVLSKMGQLSHDLKPGMTCYSDAAKVGAASSNIYLSSGPACSTQSIDAYIRDTGVPTLGHRRWILYPHLHECASGLYQKASALRVMKFGTNYNEQDLPPFIAFPSPGFFPTKFLYETWSFSGVMSNKYGQPNSMPKDTEASIVCDNKTIPFTKEIDVSNTAMYPGYVKMTLNKADIPKAGQKCTVTLTSKSMDTTWTYSMNPFDIDTYNPGDLDVEPTEQTTYCIGTKDNCGMYLVSTDQIGSYLQNTKANDITIEVRQNAATIPLNQFLAHNVNVVGYTATKPTVTFNTPGTPKKGTTQKIENIMFSTTVSEISFDSLEMVKTGFSSAVSLKPNTLKSDFDTILALSSSSSTLKTPLLKLNVDFKAVISFDSNTQITVIKKSASGKLLADQSIIIKDESATNVDIISTQPFVLKVDANSPPKNIKKVNIDVSSSPEKVIEFEGAWNQVTNSKDSLIVQSGDTPVVSKGENIPEFQNQFTEKPSPAPSTGLKPGVVAAIVIVVLVVVAAVVFAVVIIIKKKKAKLSE